VLKLLGAKPLRAQDSPTSPRSRRGSHRTCNDRGREYRSRSRPAFPFHGEMWSRGGRKNRCACFFLTEPNLVPLLGSVDDLRSFARLRCVPVGSQDVFILVGRAELTPALVGNARTRTGVAAKENYAVSNQLLATSQPVGNFPPDPGVRLVAVRRARRGISLQHCECSIEEVGVDPARHTTGPRVTDEESPGLIAQAGRGPRFEDGQGRLQGR